jgi:hypothetical protein
MILIWSLIAAGPSNLAMNLTARRLAFNFDDTPIVKSGQAKKQLRPSLSVWFTLESEIPIWHLSLHLGT